MRVFDNAGCHGVDDGFSHLYGSFPAIRLVTGRGPRGFSLFMSFFEVMVVVLSSDIST